MIPGYPGIRHRIGLELATFSLGSFSVDWPNRMCRRESHMASGLDVRRSVWHPAVEDFGRLSQGGVEIRPQLEALLPSEGLGAPAPLSQAWALRSRMGSRSPPLCTRFQQ